MAERIIQANILDDYTQCKAEYGIEVNTTRAVASIQDGLKAVARRNVQTAYELRAFDTYRYKVNEGTPEEEERTISGKGQFKSARIVGDCLGKYHPHGDTSSYDNIKKNANDFEIPYPLFNGNESNWGNEYGDRQAAMRYTETKLTDFAMDCVIGDLKFCKEVVDYKDNFSYTEKEIEAFPVLLGLLLVNGSFGIGVGIQCSVPSHNLNEVIDAHIALYDDPNAEVVLRPDSPMGCDIVDTNWKSISNTGYGKFIERAIMHYDEKLNALVVTSLPELTYMGPIEQRIKDLIKEKKILDIVDLRYGDPDNSKKRKRNDTEKQPFRYYIYLKKGSDPNYVMDFLYKNTNLQKTFTVSMEAVDDTDPSNIHKVHLSYKAYLQFVNERVKMTKFRLYNHMIRDINTTYHMREAFIHILKTNKLDEYIELVRKQKTISDAELRDIVVRKLGITPLQAKYILNIPTKKLSDGYLRQFIDDNKNLDTQLKYYESRIVDEKLLIQDIKDELLKIKNKYGRPRKSKIINPSKVNGIPEGEFKLIITNTNFVKKIKPDDSLGNIKGDMVKAIMNVDNTKNVLLFDELGKVFKLPIHKIPVGDRSTNPLDIRTILKNCTSNINTVIYEPILEKVSRLKAYHYLVVMTNRTIKKLDIADFLAVSPSGLKYTNLNDGDKVVSVEIIADGFDILTYSNNKALRFNIAEVPLQKRINAGMKIMDTTDAVEGLSVLSPNVSHIVVITEKGKVNKINVLALPLSNRAKAGSKVIKLSKGDYIRDIHGMNENDVLVVTTKEGVSELRLQDIPEGSSISTGKQMIKVLNGDSIIRCELH